MAARSGGTVLIADDQEAIRLLARRVLTRHGYDVMDAEDGACALAAARGCAIPIDVLVTDVSMPGLDGPSLATALAREGLVHRVVVISGHVSGPEAIRLAGIDRWTFLHKPFGARELVAAVETVLDGERETHATTAR